MKKAFTLMELLVVVLILGLLATVAVGVFTNQVERARYAAARTTIAAIELAATRYQLDLGEFPPSGSSLTTVVFEGNGRLYLALTRSMSGNTSDSASARWQGPYIDVKKLNLGDINGTPIDEATTGPLNTLDMADIQILDPWGLPYRYVRSNGSADDNYTVNGATELPPGNPFAATDVYYNPTTFQIFSNGRDGDTLLPPDRGTEEDDVNNFGF